MHTWKEDARRYDAPGFDLNDPAVASLFHIWQVDEATRSAAKAWMEAYLRQTADSAFTEIPAGVFDGEVFSGVAAKELKEEVGITISAESLVDMTEQVYGGRYPGMYPSPGGCDEYIKLFLYEQDVSAEQLDSFKGKATGLMEEGEYISLKVVELDRLIEETSDAKALCAFTLYQYLQSKKQ